MKKNQYKPTQILLTDKQKKIMKEKSKLIKGISRPNEGSINHYIQYAIKKTLKEEFNIDLNEN